MVLYSDLSLPWRVSNCFITYYYPSRPTHSLHRNAFSANLYIEMLSTVLKPGTHHTWVRWGNGELSTFPKGARCSKWLGFKLKTLGLWVRDASHWTTVLWLHVFVSLLVCISFCPSVINSSPQWRTDLNIFREY